MKSERVQDAAKSLLARIKRPCAGCSHYGIGRTKSCGLTERGECEVRDAIANLRIITAAARAYCRKVEADG